MEFLTINDNRLELIHTKVQFPVKTFQTKAELLSEDTLIFSDVTLKLNEHIRNQIVYLKIVICLPNRYLYLLINENSIKYWRQISDTKLFLFLNDLEIYRNKNNVLVYRIWKYNSSAVQVKKLGTHCFETFTKLLQN